MRPILSATRTYNYNLAKWLDEKLKPLSVNDHTINAMFLFADELHETEINEHDLLVSYDISPLFTNVPVDETIESIAERAFENKWSNEEHSLKITKSALIELLGIATKHQLFQFEGNLYQQVDCVAMGSPLGPLMANALTCNIEKQLETKNKMPGVYKRYVYGTLSVMTVETASKFLTLNNSHTSIDFTMALKENGRLPCLGMEVMKNGCSLNTKVYKKTTDSGLLLHYLSHVDGRYKRSLLNTILNCAFKLSSTCKFFHEECERLKETFSRLCYPDDLVQATIRKFIESKVDEDSRTQVSEKRELQSHRVAL